MTETIFGPSGYRWLTIRKRYVDLFVNVHGEILFIALERDPPRGDCPSTLTPTLRRWLQERVIPDLLARIQGSEPGSRQEIWSLGFALLTFAPVDDPPSERPGANRLTLVLCRSMPDLRRSLLQHNRDPAKGIFGLCLQRYFNDAKYRLVDRQLGELNPKTWDAIEKTLNKLLADWEEQGILVRASARWDGTLAQALLPRLPSNLDIAKWETVQRYMDVLWEPDQFVDFDQAFGIGVEPAAYEDLLLVLDQALEEPRPGDPGADDEGTNAFGLTKKERAAVHLEFIKGIKKGTLSQDFTAKYGLSRPIHREHLKSALAKLRNLLDDDLEDRT